MIANPDVAPLAGEGFPGFQKREPDGAPYSWGSRGPGHWSGRLADVARPVQRVLF